MLLRRVAGDRIWERFTVTQKRHEVMFGGERGEMALQAGKRQGGARGHCREEQQKEQRGRWKQLQGAGEHLQAIIMVHFAAHR